LLVASSAGEAAQGLSQVIAQLAKHPVTTGAAASLL